MSITFLLNYFTFSVDSPPNVNYIHYISNGEKNETFQHHHTIR